MARLLVASATRPPLRDGRATRLTSRPLCGPARQARTYFDNRSRMAADIAVTPVAIVCSGAGKYSAECSEGKGFLVRANSSIRWGAIDPSRNMKIGTPARPY